jgi:hypothetical protein
VTPADLSNLPVAEQLRSLSRSHAAMRGPVSFTPDRPAFAHALLHRVRIGVLGSPWGLFAAVLALLLGSGASAQTQVSGRVAVDTRRRTRKSPA